MCVLTPLLSSVELISSSSSSSSSLPPRLDSSQPTTCRRGGSGQSKVSATLSSGMAEAVEDRRLRAASVGLPSLAESLERAERLTPGTRGQGGVSGQVESWWMSESRSRIRLEDRLHRAVRLWGLTRGVEVCGVRLG